MTATRTCIDCEPGSRRPATKPGPRCVTHHRAIVRARKDRAHAKRVEETYGLAEGEYDALLAFQGGVCAICWKPFRAKRGAVDHDHKTGRVRGIIHGWENTILGRVRDSIAHLQAFIDYLNNPPARRAGLDRKPGGTP